LLEHDAWCALLKGFSMRASCENIAVHEACRRDGGFESQGGSMDKKTVKPWYRSTALIVGVVVTSIGGMVFVIAKHLAALMP
jgi:hypothetical protein